MEGYSDGKVVQRFPPTSPRISRFFSTRRTIFPIGATVKNAAARRAGITAISLHRNVSRIPRALDLGFRALTAPILIDNRAPQL